ncbi:MAG: hypothetical protein JSR36_19180 [Proteobacteria bacterium]|nr:hypothetical protein [Pseudomonadota bacterium]
MARAFNLIAAGAVLGLLAACSSSSHVMVGTARAPIAPEQVKIYYEPPPRYEQIATLDASSGSMFASDQSKTDEAIAKLKAEAAKLGANGILLQGVEKHQSGSIGLGVGGASYGGSSSVGTGVGGSGGLYNKNARGLAIYVPNGQ